MATRVAAAGGGSFSAGATWVGGVAPTAADDAQLGASSGNVTIDAGSVCRSLDCTGYTGTLTHAGFSLTIGDATAGASNIALKFVAGMTYSATGGVSTTIVFVSTSATVQTIDFASKSMNNGIMTFNAASNGSWKLTGGMTIGSFGQLVLTKGTLDTNGQTVSWGLFSASGTNVRTLTLGSSAITITGTSNAFDINSATNLTVTANTAVVTLTGSASSIRLTGLNMNGTSFIMAGSGVATINGAAGTTTVANFTRTGTSVKTDTLSLTVDLTCTGTCTLNSNSNTNRLQVLSSTVGAARTITAATAVVSNIVDFQDITGAGAATWTVAGTGATALGDCGGNSGITFTTPATQTATMSTNSNWDNAAIWTSRVPLPQDNVSMASVTGGQLTTNGMPRLGANIDWTGATGSPTFAPNTTNVNIYGSLTLISGMTYASSNTITFAGRGTHTITTAGIAMGSPITVAAFGGTYTLQDALSTTGVFTLSNGSFDANNFSVTMSTFALSGIAARSLTMGSGTWSITSTGGTNVWNVASATGLTFSGASSTIAITTTSASTRGFVGQGLTYGTLTYTVAGSTGGLDITSANSFAAINFSDVTNARTLRFTAATTTTVRNTNGFNVQGTSGKLMSVSSITAATHTLSSTSNQSCDYLSLTNSIAQGGGSWYAGANSTDVSGNTGWIFAAAPLTVVGGGSGGLQARRNLQNLQSLS